MVHAVRESSGEVTGAEATSMIAAGTRKTV